MLLAAISGGADSTAMLVALASLAPSLGIVVVAAHLDHGLRGKASADDCAHVQALCERLGVRLVYSRTDSSARMAARGWSGEAGLRRVRRGFLARAATHVGAVAISTAHTADDQLETMLMRLARGAGLTGMGGMRPRHGRWIKPMLAITREALRRDLESVQIAWREDASNATRAYLRNRIRLDVVPALLAALEPTASAAMHRSRGEALALAGERAAAQLREARTALAREAAAALQRSRMGCVGLSLEAGTLAAHPAAVQRLALARLWRETGVQERLTERHVSALLRLVCTGGTRSEVLLPQGYRAVRQDKVLLLRLQSAGEGPHPTPGRLRTPASESLKVHD
ncbi:MAG: tRNA lysidine(34) synthetase TilS [Candidatus Eisenbacteria bacterium]